MNEMVNITLLRIWQMFLTFPLYHQHHHDHDHVLRFTIYVKDIFMDCWFFKFVVNWIIFQRTDKVILMVNGNILHEGHSFWTGDSLWSIIDDASQAFCHNSQMAIQIPNIQQSESASRLVSRIPKMSSINLIKYLIIKSSYK